MLTQKRWEDSLNNLLEAVAYEGMATISRGILSRWYQQERFTVSIRDDIRTRFKDMEAYIPWVKNLSLIFVEPRDGVILILLKERIIDDKDRGINKF